MSENGAAPAGLSKRKVRLYQPYDILMGKKGGSNGISSVFVR